MYLPDVQPSLTINKNTDKNLYLLGNLNFISYYQLDIGMLLYQIFYYA